MRTALIVLGSVAGLAAGAIWWFFFEGRAPAAAPGVFDIAAYRTLVANGPPDRPTEVRMETVGGDLAPSWATHAGRFEGEVEMAYTAFQLVYPDRSIVIGGAVDAPTIEVMRQTDAAFFDAEAYGRLTRAMLAADQVWITHEHIDHVMAVARHPDPGALAPRLRLNASQIAMLPRFAAGDALPAPIAEVAPVRNDAARLIAPGVVVAPAAGHTAGTQVFYIDRADGTEYLLIGDIVWAMTNLDGLTTRPRITQIVVFDPNEDRGAVLRQVRALHDLRAAEPGLNIVPSHDRAHLRGLVASGALAEPFVEPASAQDESD